MDFSNQVYGAMWPYIRLCSKFLVRIIYRTMVLMLLCRLEVWPGFVTSILQFETSSMLIIDVSHKVLHFQTVLDVMYDVYNSCRGAPNFKELVAKKIIGQIVLTRSVWI